MVQLFGHRNKHETLAKPSSRYASTPLNAPGSLYTSRHRYEEEVDADGDLEDLMQQEIQRYGELFDQGNGTHAPYGDDDTLQDGSIYTSTTGLQASAALFPIVQRTFSHESYHQEHPQPKNGQQLYAEDASRWGLTNESLPSFTKPAEQTLLLKPQETAAAQACAVKSETKEVAPTVDDKKHKETPVKKNKFRPSFPKRFFNRSFSSARAVPPTPNQTTPQTQASTPAAQSNSARVKFFSPSKLFQQKPKSNIARQLHPNLLLASYTAACKQRKEDKKQAATSSVPSTAHHHPDDMQDNSEQQLNNNRSSKLISPLRLRKTVSAPPQPSPPPPIEHCEIRIGSDGNSVCSGQSSLTDALDAWMTHNTPPRIIGGDHLQDLPAHRLEAYVGGLSPPYFSPMDDEEELSIQDEAEHEEDEDYQSATDKDLPGPPGALLLTEAELYLHNNNGKSLSSSPLRVTDPEATSPGIAGEPEEDELAVVVSSAEKENREVLKEAKALEHEDVTPEDADVQVVKILGVKEEEKSEEDDVRRNLFGELNDQEKDDAEAPTVDVELVPLQQVVTPEEEDCEEEKEIVPQAKEVEEEDEPKTETVVSLPSSITNGKQHKSSKFKKFLSKLVHAPHQSQSGKNRQQTRQEALAEQWREKERIKAAEAEVERLRAEKEETERIQEKRRLEVERQRALENGSHQSHTASTGLSSGTDGDRPAAKTFSLMTGEMKTTAEESGSQVEEAIISPAAFEPADSACVFCQRLDHPRTHIVIPCMHYVLCDECVEMSREASAGVHCPTCDTAGFLYARVGVLEGQELQEKLLQVNGSGQAQQTQATTNQ